MIRNEKLFGILIICLSLLILFPKNINTLFYYDDNPIRFMVAKKIASGNINNMEEFMPLLSFGSAEIYIPSFLISRIFNIKSDELVYNLTSLFYFLLSCLLLIFFLDKNKKILQIEGFYKNNIHSDNAYIPGFAYILVIFCFLGISAVVGGHLHWLLCCSLFTIVCSKISFSQKLKLNTLDYIILGITHFISPPLAIFSVIFSLTEKRIDIFLIAFASCLIKFFPFLIILKYIKIFASQEISQENFILSDKLFLPADFMGILRFLTVDYFKLSSIFAPLIYIVAFRSIFTAKRTFILFAFLYYSIILLNIIIFKLWETGTLVPKFLIVFSILNFTSNPTRFIPLFLTFFLLYIKKIKFDDYFKIIALLFFLTRAFLSIYGFGPLPERFPESVNSVIKYILNNTNDKDKILVEGDKHIFEKGKLIHPLYNSHILPYIIAKVENRNFVGTGTPWEPFYSPFIAGKFKGKPLDKSQILRFISKNDIKHILCWTDECEIFFRNLGKKIVVIDKFKIIHLQEQ
jgi:hypothetical protein